MIDALIDVALGVTAYVLFVGAPLAVITKAMGRAGRIRDRLDQEAAAQVAHRRDLHPSTRAVRPAMWVEDEHPTGGDAA